MQVCQLCFSPYRDELLGLWKKNVDRKQLYEKYKPLMKYEGKYLSFRELVKRHIKSHKEAEDMIVPQGAGHIKHTIETIADKFTDLLGKKAEKLKPEDISVRDYSQVHRVVTEAKKIKLTESAMQIQLAKLFGPVIRGEEMESQGENNDGTRSLKGQTDQ